MTRFDDISLAVAGGLFFAVVAPLVAVVAPVFPLIFLALIAMDNAVLLLVLPFAFGGAPALIAGVLYVVIGSRLLRSNQSAIRRLPRLAAQLCAGSCVVWWLLIGATLGDGLQSPSDLLGALFVGILFSAFAAIGGYLTAGAFNWFVRRMGRWQHTTLGAQLLQSQEASAVLIAAGGGK